MIGQGITGILLTTGILGGISSLLASCIAGDVKIIKKYFLPFCILWIFYIGGENNQRTELLQCLDDALRTETTEIILRVRSGYLHTLRDIANSRFSSEGEDY